MSREQFYGRTARDDDLPIGVYDVLVHNALRNPSIRVIHVDYLNGPNSNLCSFGENLSRR
jgi:hypothetical protein